MTDARVPSEAAIAETPVGAPPTGIERGSPRARIDPHNRELAQAGGTAPEVTVVRIPQAVPAADSGLDWGDAGIGAGGMLGLVLLAAAGILAVTHRRGTSSRTATTG